LGLFDSIKKKFSSSEGETRSSLSRKVQESPQDGQARQNLGLYMLRHGEIVEGNDQLARAAILYEKGGFTTKAIAVLRQMIKNDPGNIDFHRWLIRLLGLHGLTADALGTLQKIATGGIRFASDEQRLDFYREVSQNLPDSPLPFLLVADVYLHQRKTFEAVSEMAKAVPLVVSAAMEKEFAGRMNALLALTAEHPEVFESCGFLWVAAGRREEGLTCLKQAADHARRAGETDRGAEADQIISALLEEEKAAAIAGAMSFGEAVRRLTEPQPPAPPPAKEEGKARPEEEGEDASILQSAVEKLRAKVKEEIGESDPEARYNLGIAYKEMGLLDEAVEEFRLSRSRPALFLGASCLLAETFAEKGDIDTALQTLNEVLASDGISPEESIDVRYQMAVLLSRIGKEEEAKEIFLSLYESSPDYRDLQDRVRKFQR
jgi:tetratricopeptide (TPR) repeat protein